MNTWMYHIRLRTTETRFSPHLRTNKTTAKTYLLWMKKVTCHISKQRLLQPSSHCSCPKRWALRGLRMETGCRPSRPQLLQPPPWCTSSGLRMGKHRTQAPESWGADQRNDFSQPRLLHLPIHRKLLNSLTSDSWLSLINSHLLMFQLPGLFCKTPIDPGSSLTSWEQPLRAVWDAASQA